MAGARSYWLFKSEPEVFSIEDLAAAKDRSTCWEGVRNYQARNTLRDLVKVGDLVLFYHSSSDEIGVAGLAEVVRAGYPDHTALDPKSDYHDPKSTAENPTWYMVDIQHRETFPRLVTLAQLKATKGLEEMLVTKRGQRLSVQPVTKAEFDVVVKLAKSKK